MSRGDPAETGGNVGRDEILRRPQDIERRVVTLGKRSVTDDVDFLRFVLPKRLGDFRADH
jgi:hypothetical protein